MNHHSISVYQARYVTYIVDKYLDTVTFKKSEKFYNRTLPFGMIFTKDYLSIIDYKFKKLIRELNIHYKACIG